MTLEQRTHDIGLAFATCKMNSRDNSEDTEDTEEARHAQFLNFITDYTFAAFSYASTEAERGNLFKD